MPDRVVAGAWRLPFVRFAVVGAVTGAIHLGGFVLLRTWWEPVVANAVALTVATVVNTEGNRRISFTEERSEPVWRQHVKAAVALLASLAVAAVAFSALDPGHRVLEVAVVVGADATSILVRYLLLRHWVFPPTRGGVLARPDHHG
ncbi:GtrA family protein [Isoptericola halotolerans]|uniref:GtrA family protein n=1 Tax=Isoptericola halotolerans TaxID=300560 RepID=UPI00388E4A83